MESILEERVLDLVVLGIVEDIGWEGYFLMEGLLARSGEVEELGLKRRLCR